MYAVERQPGDAAPARRAVAGFAGRVTIVEGSSTAIELPATTQIGLSEIAASANGVACPLRPVDGGRMWPAPEPDCWLHPAVEVRSSPIQGDGLFARTPISAGATVSRLGGRLVSTDELKELLASADGYVDTIAVADDVHLVLPPGRPNGKGNHSCDPNLWWAAPYTLTARRDIAAGEELTTDYATSTGVESFAMPCRCGTRRCRGVVTGHDWAHLDLRQRYGDHWVPALVSRIDRAR